MVSRQNQLSDLRQVLILLDECFELFLSIILESLGSHNTGSPTVTLVLIKGIDRLIVVVYLIGNDV